MSRSESRAGKRKTPAATAPVPPPEEKPTSITEEDSWFVEEVTTSESAAATEQRMRRAEAEAAAFEQRKTADSNRKATVESPIPSFLAASTQELEVADDDLQEVDGAPVAAAADEITRQIGVDRSPAEGVRNVGRSSTPPPLPKKKIDHDAVAAARIRAAELVDRCREALNAKLLADAAAVAEQVIATAETAPAPGIAEVIDAARPMLERAFAEYVGGTERVPRAAVDAATLSARTLDHRAGFLMSRIDGHVSIEGLLEIAAMARFDALRTLSTLLREGLIRIG